MKKLSCLLCVLLLGGCTGKSADQKLLSNGFIQEGNVYTNTELSEQACAVSEETSACTSVVQFDFKKHEMVVTNTYEKQVDHVYDDESEAYVNEFRINWDKNKVTRIKNQSEFWQMNENGEVTITDNAAERIDFRLNGVVHFVCEYDPESETYGNVSDKKAMNCEDAQALPKAYAFYEHLLEEYKIKEADLMEVMISE